MKTSTFITVMGTLFIAAFIFDHFHDWKGQDRCDPYQPTDGKCWVTSRSGYMSGVSDPGYDQPLPGLLSDFGKPEGFHFTEEELTQALKANRYLIVQTRKPIVIYKPIVLTGQTIDGGIYMSYDEPLFDISNSSGGFIKNAMFEGIQ